MPERPASDPIRHTSQIRDRIADLMQHLEEDVGKVDEPQAKALFETARETLGGLKKAFEDYEKKNEEAWSDSAQSRH